MNEKHKIFLERLGAAIPDELKIVGDVWKVYEIAGLPRPHAANDLFFGQGNQIKKILDKNNEMLCALVDIVYKFQSIVPTNTKYVKEYQYEFESNYAMQIKAIESATSRSWEEVRKIYMEVMA